MAVRLSGNERKKLAAAIKADIDAFCVAHFAEEHRSHLGSSIIGEDCLRKLVYVFRWMHKEQFDGRMLRLFNRGHKEEFRFVEWLRGIGAEVWEVTEDGKQFRMSDANGHYGGSLDGITRLPPKYQLNFPFVLEMKTHNDKSFKKLEKLGVRQSKPMHYKQMCNYGTAYEMDYAIYLATNKNDDDIYIEVVDVDKELGKSNTAKARNIIAADTLPLRIAANPSYDTCKYCSMVGICHLDKPVDVNCRSCRFSKPVEDGQWLCSHWGSVIPKDEISKACANWAEFGK